jgi:hypothetical protein
VVYVDENDDGTAADGDNAVYIWKYDNATGKEVGAGNQFTWTLSSGYLFQFN